MKSTIIKAFAFGLAAVLSLSSCNNQKSDKLTIDYEEYTLDNGLKVVLHEDHSDPVVAQAITFHVGSAREKEGKTGFAHFFEHMLFQRSENLPRNAFFTEIASMGGDFNGGTSNDYTIYYEAVPRNALEKILWMESDRMGFFINTVTQPGLEREIDVICNEKRQTEINNAYGQMNGIMSKALFPKGHPYNWTVIGEMADIKSATIEDVKEFYSNYYVPSNATLCIAGDFDPAETKEMIEKYFGEIKSHPVEKPKQWDVTLDSTKLLYYEDQFAQMPALEIAMPSVSSGHEDEAALDVLASLFAGSKKTPLYKTVVEANLAPEAAFYDYCRESAGTIYMEAIAYPGIDLDQLVMAYDKAKLMFEQDGVDPDMLETVKAEYEVSTYNQLSSILNKALLLARDKEFYGKADYVVDEIEAINNVTAEDVMRVYEKYVKNANYVAVCAVPEGQAELAVEGCALAETFVEDINDQTNKSEVGALADDNDYEHTPSKIDRTITPAYMPNTPQTTLPNIWEGKLANGIGVMGITNSEIPMANINITIKGGMLLEPADKIGLASVNAYMMNEGTALRTASEIEQAISKLGASVNVSANSRFTTISIRSLVKNLDQVMTIVYEMISQPRFDQSAFDRAIMTQNASIDQTFSSTSGLAFTALNDLYTYQTVYTKRATKTTLANITLDDVKNYFTNLTAGNAYITVAGDVDKDNFIKVCEALNAWGGDAVAIPEVTLGENAAPGKYFIDFPGAMQSYIIVASGGMKANDPMKVKQNVLNEKLGAGSNGMLFNVLRLQRGYTYGAYSSFGSTNEFGYFQAQSSVQGSVTKESVDLFTEILGGYGESFTPEMLQETKDALLRANAFAFETNSSLLNMLNTIYRYNMPKDYVIQDEQTINATTIEDIKALAAQELNPDKFVYIVVGDAASQFKNVSGAQMYQIEP